MLHLPDSSDPRAQLAQAALRAGLDAAMPRHALSAAIKARYSKPPANGKTWVCAVGKSACAMAQAFAATYPYPYSGLIVTRQGFDRPVHGFELVTAAHPIPDERSARAGETLLALLRNMDVETRVVFLISGGTSSLIFTPRDGVDPAKSIKIFETLYRMGLPITVMNALRQRLSKTAAGALADATPPPIDTFVISDVTGDCPEAIGSGPTLWPLPLADDVTESLPQEIRAMTSEPLGTPDTSRHVQIVASPNMALRAASDMLVRSGIRTVIDPFADGDVEAVSARHAAQLEAIAADGNAVALLSGGELTLDFSNARSRPNARGGPNQEYALRMALMAAEQGRPTLAVAIDTDGIDGNGNAMGACVKSEALTDKNAAFEALFDHDVETFNNTHGHMIPGWPTGTNVNDLRIVVTSEGR